ncbi:MAG: glycosyltransferase, partial [Candidatus Omnitrophica bacterium]|nr:glycosyltransferase [Candidatus Omnitrophota bacterium]
MNADNKTRVLHAITRLDRGGSSENTLLSAIGLVGKGYSVDILFGRTENPNLGLLERAEKAGVEFIQEEDLVRNIHPVADLTALLNIRYFLRRNRYDIVHVHSSKAGLICRLAARALGID